MSSFITSRDDILSRITAFRETVEKPLIAIIGATGTGKTALSIAIARQLDGEVINADSRQLYRGMEIGAAVATTEERQGVPHHLLSFLDPPEVFTLSDYQRAAFEQIDTILKNSKLPLLVGGTGLYINAVCLNYDIPNIPPDPALRTVLQRRLQTEGFEVLRAELHALDPQTAESLERGQHQYLVRALEIALHGGTKSAMARQNPPRYDCLYILLEIDRETLKERITARVQQQLDAGVLDEVRSLLNVGYDERTHALDGISCKEWIPYLHGQSSLEACIAETIRNNLRYAKRQATWFRGLSRKIPSERLIILPIT